MKIALSILGTILLLFAVAAGIGWAKDLLVLRNLSGYQQEEFTIAGTRAVHRIGEDGTDYFLRGRSGKGEYEFPISAARYEELSPATAVGRTITLHRNPRMPSLTLQKKSVNVIFADEWRDPAQVATSAGSTMWMALAGFAGAILAFGGARLSAPRSGSR